MYIAKTNVLNQHNNTNYGLGLCDRPPQFGLSSVRPIHPARRGSKKYAYYPRYASGYWEEIRVYGRVASCVFTCPPTLLHKYKRNQKTNMPIFNFVCPATSPPSISHASPSSPILHLLLHLFLIFFVFSSPHLLFHFLLLILCFMTLFKQVNASPSSPLVGQASNLLSLRSTVRPKIL